MPTATRTMRRQRTFWSLLFAVMIGLVPFIPTLVGAPAEATSNSSTDSVEEIISLHLSDPDPKTPVGVCRGGIRQEVDVTASHNLQENPVGTYYVDGNVFPGRTTGPVLSGDITSFNDDGDGVLTITITRGDEPISNGSILAQTSFEVPCEDDNSDDSDGDGVPDSDDKCPGTPEDTPVDEDGCANNPPKVDICHRTASHSNPYVSISVAQSSVDGDNGNDKGQGDHYAVHTGPVFPDLSGDGKWGDIIPPIEGVHDGLNWTDEGRSVYNNDCSVVPPVNPEASCPEGTVEGQSQEFDLKEFDFQGDPIVLSDLNQEAVAYLLRVNNAPPSLHDTDANVLGDLIKGVEMHEGLASWLAEGPFTNTDLQVIANDEDNTTSLKGTLTECLNDEPEVEVVKLPADQETVDICNPSGVQDNVTWADDLPEDTDQVNWSESEDGRTRTASLKSDNAEWADGTTNDKIWELPADSGEQCPQPTGYNFTVEPNQGSCEVRTPRATVTTEFASSIGHSPNADGSDATFQHEEEPAGAYDVTLDAVAQGNTVEYYIVVSPLDDQAELQVEGPFTFSVPEDCDKEPPTEPPTEPPSEPEPTPTQNGDIPSGMPLALGLGLFVAAAAEFSRRKALRSSS